MPDLQSDPGGAGSGADLRVGDLVRCRATGRVGRIGSMVSPDQRGRRFYVDWSRVDFSLVADDEVELTQRAPDGLE